MFINKVIELRKQTHQHEEEKTGQKIDIPEDNFGEGLDDRHFIKNAFKTRFQGLGAQQNKYNEHDDNAETNIYIKYGVVTLLLAAIGLVGYITKNNHSKKVLFHFQIKI